MLFTKTCIHETKMKHK